MLFHLGPAEPDPRLSVLQGGEDTGASAWSQKKKKRRKKTEYEPNIHGCGTQNEKEFVD